MSTSPTPMLTERAITRARQILLSGVRLQESARTLDDVRRQFGDDGSMARAADGAKEAWLLAYRVSTVPEMLAPILEALIAAASGNLPDN